MAEYIEREAVKEAIGFINLHFVACGENKSLLDGINEIPAADVVPVVRCKDCRYCNGVPLNILACGYWSDNGWDAVVMPDDFCSYGERNRRV